MIKENFWKEDLGSDKPIQNFDNLIATLNEHQTEFMEANLDSDSTKVSTTIAGYIAKKLAKRSKCDVGKYFLIANEMDKEQNDYLNTLSLGALVEPSSK